MNIGLKRSLGYSACPHDCPSTCALDVDLRPDGTIGRLHGARENSYTAGVICAKVARYAERIHHPDRLLKPLVRRGAKGQGEWQEATWDAALDHVAEKFTQAEKEFGSETVWPYQYAGTMGLVQRDGIHRLRHAKRYSNQFDSICTNPAWTGFVMGTGRLAGPDPREMASSDCIVIWGTNPVSTQINVMAHVTRARKTRGAKLIVVDIYENDTVRKADLALLVRPGTDAALACAVMHILFRDGMADRGYMDRYTDDPKGLEAHLRNRTPQWASDITGLSTASIEEFARIVGTTNRTYFRLGYGFTRSRNGAAAMHAALSIASVGGHWQYEGGGAFHSNSAIFGLDKSEIEGQGHRDPSIRWLDQSRIGRILTGDAGSLSSGPPVTAMLIQNTNPANVAPEQRLVKKGLLREDLFVCVHEQFMTETAQLADVVLPATMFLEHDDIYRGGGHQHILAGPKLIDPPCGPKSNHDVIEELARRLGVDDLPEFGHTPRQLMDRMLARAGLGTYDDLVRDRWIDMQPDFGRSHFIDGFGHPDGKFRFRPDWSGSPAPNRPPQSMGLLGPVQSLPAFPDHVDLTENTDDRHPFRLATSPARSFLNSTFSETPGSRRAEGRPELLMNAADARRLDLENGSRVLIGNTRGEIRIHVRLSRRLPSGTVIAEGLWPNEAFEDGEGINVLVGADPIAPYGGAAFHDNHVWIRKI